MKKKRHMKLLKKVLPIMLTVPLLFSLTDFNTVYALTLGDNFESHEYIIAGAENVRDYMNEIGETYDPSLIFVKRTMYSEVPGNLNSAGIMSAGLFEYELRNLSVTTETDTTELLREYKRPKGTVSVTDTISISNKFSASSKVKAKTVEAEIGYSLTETNSFLINWTDTFDKAIVIKIYPVYEVTDGELWEDDVWFDDYIGSFTAKKAIGDEIRVYWQ